MKSVSINGIDIAYRVDGNPDKPWMALSNSLATDHRMWDSQMDILTRTHRVLRYDTRGHGQSQSLDGAYSLAMLADDLASLLDALEIKSADILGLSLGGMTAIGLALDHAHFVNRLICCDARADAPADYAEGWHQRIEVVRKDGMPSIVEGTIARWFTQAFLSDFANEPTINLAKDMISSTSIDGFCGCAAALTQLNYAPRLGEIQVPTLCVAGSEDVAAPVDVMAAMADCIPSASLSVIENAAHITNMNNTIMFNKTISEWL